VSSADDEKPAPVLDPIDRVSEVILGLLMALTFTGSLSVATAGREDVRTMMIAALGCNLAWGLAAAVMYLVRSVTERTRKRTLLAQLRAADAAAGQRLVVQPRLVHDFGRIRNQAPEDRRNRRREADVGGRTRWLMERILAVGAAGAMFRSRKSSRRSRATPRQPAQRRTAGPHAPCRRQTIRTVCSSAVPR
jgi:hypothetical protein